MSYDSETEAAGRHDEHTDWCGVFFGHPCDCGAPTGDCDVCGRKVPLVDIDGVQRVARHDNRNNSGLCKGDSETAVTDRDAPASPIPPHRANTAIKCDECGKPIPADKAARYDRDRGHKCSLGHFCGSNCFVSHEGVEGL